MSGTAGAAPANGAAGEVDGGGDNAPSRQDVEARASRMGWAPRHKFRGDPDRWVDADEFIERGEQMLPLALERNKVLDRTVQTLQRQIDEQGNSIAKLVETSRRAEQVGYKRAMRELVAKREAAVEAGDKEGFRAAEAEIRDLGPEPEAPPPPQQRQQQPAVDPAVTAWVGRNRWFDSDPIARNAAIAALDVVQRQYPNDTMEEHLAEVEAQMREAFPRHFPAARRRAADPPPDDGGEGEPATRRDQRAPLVSRSGTAPSRPAGPRSFEALPQEAKREYERQAKAMAGKGKPFTKQEYAEYYWEGEE